MKHDTNGKHERAGKKTNHAFSFLAKRKSPNKKSTNIFSFIYNANLLIFLSVGLICKISKLNQISVLCTNICKKTVGIELCLFLKSNDN